MNATRRAFRYCVGVVFGFVGLGVAWELITWTLSTLSPPALAELFAHQGFSILAVIAALGLAYLLGNAAMWAFDAVLKTRRGSRSS